MGTKTSPILALPDAIKVFCLGRDFTTASGEKMIVTTIVINSDTSEDTVSAIEALTKKLRERGLAETAPLGQKNSIVIDHAVVMYSMNKEA
jgi:hypothetical protein